MGAHVATAWRLPSIPRLRWKPALAGMGALLVALALVVAGANLLVLERAGGKATATIADVPHAQTAIVPGALVNDDGSMSAMLAARVERTAALWRAGKVDRVLVSGDHHTWAYDEPDTMRKALVAEGVPARVIFEDHAGFDTWSTVVRAREIFGVTSAVIVTQGFHMPRALYEAEAAGLEASGLTADTQGWGAQGTKSSLREIAARVKAVYETSTGAEVMSGPRIPITGDDGRASWGPRPPAGTPPAGAPGR